MSANPITKPETPEIKCLPECDEQHAEDCPAAKAEMDYWAAYFGVKNGALQNFAPVSREQHIQEWKEFKKL